MVVSTRKWPEPIAGSHTFKPEDFVGKGVVLFAGGAGGFHRFALLNFVQQRRECLPDDVFDDVVRRVIRAGGFAFRFVGLKYELAGLRARNGVRAVPRRSNRVAGRAGRRNPRTEGGQTSARPLPAVNMSCRNTSASIGVRDRPIVQAAGGGRGRKARRCSGQPKFIVAFLSVPLMSCAERLDVSAKPRLGLAVVIGEILQRREQAGEGELLVDTCADLGSTGSNRRPSA